LIKNKKKLSKSILKILLLLIVIAFAVYYINNYFSRLKFVKYSKFGISLPVKYSIHGIDVSLYQGNIDWEVVKAMKVDQIKIGFAFIKATEGLGMIDNKFSKNWFYAKQVSIPRGAYHFFNINKSGKGQAKHFIETVNLSPGDFPPILDIESNVNRANAKNVQQQIKNWLMIIEKHYKVKPIIYTNISCYENYLVDDFDDYPLWIAHYYATNAPLTNRKWIMWQHNEKGRVNGINTYVDFNVFKGDSASFNKLLIK